MKASALGTVNSAGSSRVIVWTTSGRSSASWRTTGPLLEWPATCTRRTPRWSSRPPASAAWSAMLTGGAVWALPAQPRRWDLIMRDRSGSAGWERSGKKPRGTAGLLSSTGSPAPTTSYSSSTPLTFALSMRPPPISPVDRGLVPPEMGEEDGYGGNPYGYVRGRLPRAAIRPRLGERAMSDDAGHGLVERARDAAARNDWRQAFDLLMEADTDGLLAPTGLDREGVG